jgi:predicted component of viral defense system (DUF524 family)
VALLQHRIFKKGNEADEITILKENTEYVVEFLIPLTDANKKELLLNYHTIMQPIHSQLYVINFGNFVGKTDFCGKRYEVRSWKLNEDQINEMLHFVSNMIATLPYQESSPTKIKVKNDTERELIFYHVWNNLRQALLVEWDGASLVDWWTIITQDPHHHLKEEKVLNPFWQSKEIDNKTIQGILMNPQTWQPIHQLHTLSNSAIAQRLRTDKKNYFPSEIEQKSRYITHDTPENRMLKYILEEFDEMILEMDQILRKRKFFNHLQITEDNHKMKELIEDILFAHFFKGVGPLTHIPASSTVLQRKNGYRQWYSFYQQILLGSNFPLPYEDITSIIEGKDLATLYEYWCYFTIVDLIQQLTGFRPGKCKRVVNNDGYGVLKEGLQITFALNIEKLYVYYNKTFSRHSGSYSQSYRPDISLEWKGYWYHFDAKLKFTPFTRMIDHNGEADYEEGRKVKKEDIDKMHTYKDAITGTKSVWVLFPNDGPEGKRVFYMDPRDETLESGIGAVGCIPGSVEGVRVVLRGILGLE